MKTNLRKIAGIAAVAVFLVALVINVKVTMDDPFAMVNEKALAEETTHLKFTPVEKNCYKSLYCVVDGQQIEIRNDGTKTVCELDTNGSSNCSEIYCNAEEPECEPL